MLPFNLQCGIIYVGRRRMVKEKNTDELENILKSMHEKDFDLYVEGQKDSLIDESNSFSVFLRDKISEHGLNQREVFIYADIPERFGYKLLSGEKRTAQRDTLLRICYAGGLTLDETQTVLKKYEMPKLYAKIPRDALLIVLFNERVGSIIDVNVALKEHGFDPLRPCGVQE